MNMNHGRPADPVDFLLRGQPDQAANAYVDLYLEAARTGDRYVGSYILGSLAHALAALAAKEAEGLTGGAGKTPESALEDVEPLILRRARESGVSVDIELVRKDIGLARQGLRASKKRAEQSVEAVEDDGPRRQDRNPW